MAWYTYNYYAPSEKMRAIFSKHGYITESVVVYLKREFGYKNGKEIRKDLNVNCGFTNAILAYKESEKEELFDMMSALCHKLRDQEINYRRYSPGVYSLGITIYEGIPDPWSKTVQNKFEIRRRFKSLIDELLGVPKNIYD